MQKYLATGWKLKVINYIGALNLMILFLICRAGYVLVDSIIDFVTGYSIIRGSKEERSLAEESFEHSAHFVHIVGRFTYDFKTGGFLKAFILRHNRYGSPKEILENDYITIHGTLLVSRPEYNIVQAS